jgi:hypothetical protein
MAPFTSSLISTSGHRCQVSGRLRVFCTKSLASPDLVGNMLDMPKAHC